jgi:hypothetical protein
VAGGRGGRIGGHEKGRGLFDTDRSFECALCPSTQGTVLKIQVTVVPHHGVSKEHIVPPKFLQPEQSACDPPKTAEFLLTVLLKSSQVEGVKGDLREQFDSDCQRLGQRRAVWLYWRRTIESLWPLLRRAIGKAFKWGVLAAAVKRIFDHSVG